MYIENGIAFTDGTREEVHFQHRTFLDAEGRPFYLVPFPLIEKDHPGKYGLTKNAQWTLPFGHGRGRRYVLYIATYDRAKAEECWKEVNSEHQRQLRKKRCTILVRRSTLKRCPDGHSCDACPHPEKIVCYNPEGADREPPADTAAFYREPGDGQEQALRAEDRMLLKQIFATMDRSSVLYATARVLHDHYGVAVRDIAKVFGCSESEVYRLLSRAKEIGQRFREEAAEAETQA